MPSSSDKDPGWHDEWRGWYDIQGCGKCNDYCRWVGDSGSGGDPNVRQNFGSSFWSCRRAGTTETYSHEGVLDTVKSWVKCTHQGAKVSGNTKTNYHINQFIAHYINIGIYPYALRNTLSQLKVPAMVTSSSAMDGV